MKKLFLIAIVFLSCVSVNAQDLEWGTNYKTVLQKAKSNKKPILVYFSGSDWCKPCIMLKKDLFDNVAYKKLLLNYNLLYVDLPQNRDLVSEDQYNHNKGVMNQLNSKKKFPAVVILNRRGKEKDRISGYSGKDQLPYYIQFLNKEK